VRRFNRFCTRQICVARKGLVLSPVSPTEMQVVSVSSLVPGGGLVRKCDSS
jgi:hypothetical protein